MKRETPATGEVWLADLEPIRGSEQGSRRPVIIFQNPGLARVTTTFLAVPLTGNTARLGTLGTCCLRAGDDGLRKDSIALGFQARALDRSRLVGITGKLSEESVEAVADAILMAFGIEVVP
jgi:mRNA interferase MazF